MRPRKERELYKPCQPMQAACRLALKTAAIHQGLGQTIASHCILKSPLKRRQHPIIMVAVDVRQTVANLCGTKGDETIREYITAVLELGDFDFGREGENAYESFGQMLVFPPPVTRLQPTGTGMRRR